jgi:hypothetical protein
MMIAVIVLMTVRRRVRMNQPKLLRKRLAY